MATLYTLQSTNVRRTWFLMSAFFIAVMMLGWAASLYFRNPGLLYGFMAFSIFMNIFSYWFSDKIVLSMHGAEPVTRGEHRELWNVVENLCITAGLPMPKLYIIDAPAPNAFATGRDKEHAAVAVTSGLLEMMKRNELEGVIAHELSHIGNRDILLQTVVVVLVGFVTLLADFFLRSSIFGMGGGDRDRDNGAGAITLIIGIVLSTLAPIFAQLIQLAISRRREYLADASGALLTRYPEGLARALEKIAGDPNQLQHLSSATNHLYIEDPIREKESWFAKLFSTHPPIADRIKKLREMTSHS